MTTRKEIDERVVKGFMCGVDWQHELGAAAGGNRIFATVEDLKRCYPCVEECGIVEVGVRLKRWVLEQDFDREINTEKPKEKK